MKPARSFAVVACLLMCLATLPAEAQQRDEPTYEDLMEFVTRDYLSLGTLFQAVLDPSVDPDDAESGRVSLANARLLLGGVLDNGFRYFLQTNFAASPSVLDARVGWVYDERFGVWAGRFKTPFNQELLDYAGSTDFIDRARVVSELGTDRQLGVQIASQVGIATLHLGGFTGPNSTPAGDDLVGVGRVSVLPDLDGDQSLRVGASVAFGRDGAVGGRALGSTFDGEATLFEVDARYERGAFTIAGEGVFGSYSTSTDDGDGSGLYLTGGWHSTERTQLLLRWDRYTRPGSDNGDNQMVFGFNAWPTTASEIQVNWVAPMGSSSAPHRLLINFQIGFGSPQSLF